jgi:hypothetical protein
VAYGWESGRQCAEESDEEDEELHSDVVLGVWMLRRICVERDSEVERRQVSETREMSLGFLVRASLVPELVGSFRSRSTNGPPACGESQLSFGSGRAKVM